MALSFDKVNQVITVLSPDTEITIQNLLNSIREWEDELSSMDVPKVVSCAGKEPLGGGVVVGLTLTLLDDWQLSFEARTGPSYTQCTVSGGNIVAVNANGSIYPTAFTQVLITASSSATQSDLEAIQYASYQNAVWVNPLGANSGTEYPVGTRETPVNNIQDAVSIGNSKGFKTLQILNDITIGTGDVIIGFKLVGVSHILTNVVIETGALCENVQIESCNITGVLDGGTEINDCIVSDLVYFNGHIHNSGLVGLVTLAGNEKAVFSDCKTIDQDNSLVIDMGGSGQSVAIPNYSGLLTIRNLNSASEEIGIGLNAGMVILEDTITAGTIIIGGNGLLMHTQTGTENVNSDGLISKTGIAETVWDELKTDHTLSGSFGNELATVSDLTTSEIINSTLNTSATIIEGVTSSGSSSDINVRDTNEWEISEDAATGLTVEFIFNIPNDDQASEFSLFGNYSGSPGLTHFLDLWAYNYVASSWELLSGEFLPGGITEATEYTETYYESHIDRTNNNEVKLRLIHNVTTYNNSHALNLDFVGVTSIEQITAELETDPIVKLAAILNL